MVKRILMDSSVWISYFGDRNDNEISKKRIDLAKQIIDFCLEGKYQLFYCAYIINELENTQNSKRAQDLIKLKSIAQEIPSHFGDDTWDQIDLTWNQIGSKWNNVEEVKIEEKIKEKILDKPKKSNRVDRKILLSSQQENIEVILHENPKDFGKIKDELNIQIVDLLKIHSLEEFKRVIKK